MSTAGHLHLLFWLQFHEVPSLASHISHEDVGSSVEFLLESSIK